MDSVGGILTFVRRLVISNLNRRPETDITFSCIKLNYILFNFRFEFLHLVLAARKNTLTEAKI